MKTKTASADSSANGLTIGKLAAAAGVNVETVRYYERRGLIAQPASNGGYRRYGAEHIERLAFIRRAQGMGFSLDEIVELMQLNDMTDHLQARRLAEAKIATISERIAHLQQMQHALQHLVKTCKPGKPCPIIDMALDEGASASRLSSPTTCHLKSSH
jgi:MerR family mercuric resistance operon transcriptional regulator